MLDERTLRALSAMRTDLHRNGLQLKGIFEVIDFAKLEGAEELYHWQSGSQALVGAQACLKEAVHKVEAALVWLSPLENDDSSSA